MQPGTDLHRLTVKILFSRHVLAEKLDAFEARAHGRHKIDGERIVLKGFLRLPFLKSAEPQPLMSRPEHFFGTDLFRKQEGGLIGFFGFCKGFGFVYFGNSGLIIEHEISAGSSWKCRLLEYAAYLEQRLSLISWKAQLAIDIQCFPVAIQCRLQIPIFPLRDFPHAKESAGLAFLEPRTLVELKRCAIVGPCFRKFSCYAVEEGAIGECDRFIFDITYLSGNG